MPDHCITTGFMDKIVIIFILRREWLFQQLAITTPEQQSSSAD
jgi:hypothetical protein